MVSLLVTVVTAKADDNYRFLSLTTNDGLSSSMIQSMLIDSEGFLWIGTAGGLDRYDGYEVESMGKDMGEKYRTMAVSELQEDAKHNIWIECEHTYLIYNIETHTFSDKVCEHLRNLGIETNNENFKVKIDDMGMIWVIMEGRMHRYNPQSKKLDSWSNPHITLQDLKSRLCTASRENMLLCNKQCVWKFSSSGNMERLSLPAEMQRKDNICGTFIDADHTIWIYSIMDEKICRYSVGGKTVKEMILLPSGDTSASRNNAIRCMMDDGRGNIWIGTDHKGIFIYHKQTGEITNIVSRHNERNSLSSSNVISLVKDHQGTIWMGHYKTGISYTSANCRMFETKGQKYGDVSALYYDSRGNLWIGTDGEGLYVEHSDGTYVKTTLPNITISDITEDTDGSIWVGTYSEGLFHLTTPVAYEQYSLANGKFPTNNAWRIIDDKRGHIWCASPINPLIRYDKKSGRCTYVKDQSNKTIQGIDFCFDKRGTLLVTTTYGLVTYDFTTDKACRLTTNRRGTQQFTSYMTLLASYDSRQDLLLLGHKTGITIFDMRKDQLHYIGDEVNGQRIKPKSIIQDKYGKFWISTANGISRLDITRSKDTKLHWELKNYTSREGLQTQFFNSNSQTKSSSGNILFGSIEGYMLIRPAEISSTITNTNAPKIVSASAGDRHLDIVNHRITLRHDDTHIKIRYFTGILNNTNTIRYAYKVKGVMNEWTYTEGNQITLVGLSPGEYKLLLRICDDNLNENESELIIQINRPFYLTGWAYTVYTLLICIIAYLLWNRSRQKQIEKLQTQREDLERQKLMQITEMKLQFFTNISHDLRTPLTLIISPIEMIVKMLEQGQTPRALIPQLRNVHKNAQILFNQVGSLLDFRRLDVGAEVLQPSVSDIVEQIASICLSFDDYAEERRINLQFQSQHQSCMMEYDKEKMSKIIYNLLSNAFKFTPEGGRIIVGFDKTDNEATIFVSDTGKGIPDEEKENIFHRFYQSKTNATSQTGSGIGLHIVHEYVTMQGGSIKVSDNMPNGSIFTFRIPITEMATPPAACSATESGAAPVTDSADSAPGRACVLVIDDSSDIVTFLASYLSDDYDVLTASDGQKALDILQNQTVSLIISDVMMPGIDGYELCRRLKSDISTSHIPLILLTAKTTDDNKLEGLQLGADDYITKPFNMEVLKLRVQKLLEWAERNHREFRKKLDITPSEITITPLDEQFMQKALKLVEQHLDNSEFTVETLGQELGMSRSFLYKKLMAITGLGPAEFIRTIRIKRGKSLLEQSQMQISEIAYTVGFNSAKSFSMNFKAEYGMTPSEYLKAYKNGSADVAKA